MKINGSQIVPGMYVFDSNQTYTANDFVVHDGVIYTCVKDVYGKDVEKDGGPENSDAFTIYLGEKSRAIDFQDYLDFLEEAENLPWYQKYLKEKNEDFQKSLEFLEKPGGENKYLSVGMLQAIMSYYLLGISGKGIIGDYICYDSEGLRISLRIQNWIDTNHSFSNPETILSDIMFHPEINHAIIRVSRFLPEINGYVGDLGVSEFSGEDQKSVILRQYSYTQEETGDLMRLQEIVDPIDGVIWFRSGNMTTKLNTTSGTWKCSVANNRALKTKAENILGVYSARLKVMRSLEDNLKSNFRYKTMDLEVAKPTSFSSKYPELTITVSQVVDGYLKNYQTSIDLSQKLGGVIPDYLVGDKYRITTTEDEDGYHLSLLDKNSGQVSTDSWFSGAYYKEYYGLS